MKSSVLNIPSLQLKSSLSLTIITQITHKCYYNFSQYFPILFFPESSPFITNAILSRTYTFQRKLMLFQLSLSLLAPSISLKNNLKEASSKSCLFIQFMTFVLWCRSQRYGVWIISVTADQDPIFSLPQLLSTCLLGILIFSLCPVSHF